MTRHLSLILMLAACGGPREQLPAAERPAWPVPTAPPPASPPGPAVPIEIGDDLDIEFIGHPDLSFSHVRVDGNGRIRCLFIGDVAVEGRLPDDVAREIQKRLAEDIGAFQVKVRIVRRAADAPVGWAHVVGALEAKVPLPENVPGPVGRLLELAGGLPSATRCRIRVCPNRTRGQLSVVEGVVEGERDPSGVLATLVSPGDRVVVSDLGD